MTTVELPQAHPDLEGVLTTYARFEAKAKMIEKAQESLKAELARLMDEAKLTSYKGDMGTISRVDGPTTRVDNAKLRSMVPQELVEKAQVTTHSNYVAVRPAKVVVVGELP